MLRVGIFEDFKGASTLLFWGDDGLPQLRDLFRGAAIEATRPLAMDELAWVAPSNNCSVHLLRGAIGAVQVERRNGADVVRIDLTSEQLMMLADRIDTLLQMSAGHHYLEIAADQPLQIMISKGEYSLGTSATKHRLERAFGPLRPVEVPPLDGEPVELAVLLSDAYAFDGARIPACRRLMAAGLGLASAKHVIDGAAASGFARCVIREGADIGLLAIDLAAFGLTLYRRVIPESA